VPDGIRYDHLPRYYSPDSGAGCYVFAAAIQHSICEAMTQNFLPPLGPYADRKLWAVSEALFRSNESHEAIWRLMTVNAILGDQRMVDEYKARLREVATSLLSSWKPFPGDNQKKETLDRLTELLTDCATVSLELQKIRKRIHVSTDVVSEYFDSDSEEDLYKVLVALNCQIQPLRSFAFFPHSLGPLPQRQTRSQPLSEKEQPCFVTRRRC
jgi:hypothetical protein